MVRYRRHLHRSSSALQRCQQTHTHTHCVPLAWLTFSYISHGTVCLNVCALSTFGSSRMRPSDPHLKTADSHTRTHTKHTDNTRIYYLSDAIISKRKTSANPYGNTSCVLHSFGMQWFRVLFCGDGPTGWDASFFESVTFDLVIIHPPDMHTHTPTDMAESNSHTLLTFSHRQRAYWRHNH